MAVEKSPVRRCLFGRPDRTQNHCVSDVDDSDAERFRKNWNFDTKTDQALEGEYVWERQSPTEVPLLYLKNYSHKYQCRRHTALCRDDVEESSDSCDRSPGSPSLPLNVDNLPLQPNPAFRQYTEELTPVRKNDSLNRFDLEDTSARAKISFSHKNHAPKIGLHQKRLIGE